MKYSARISLAKMAIKAKPFVPYASRDSVGELQEIFEADFFTTGSEADKREIMLNSSRNKYASEMEYPWDHYFGFDLAPLLTGKSVLDLGCFNGGRGVAWFERYRLARITGIDVRSEYIEAARQFASVKHVPAQYEVASGERLPFSDSSFDALLSFDVLEHVQDLRTTMSECWRVLKPGGLFFLVFPGYFQPWEHHLSLATRTPFLQWFFSGRTLVRAYSEVLAEREDAAWYARKSPDLECWERGNTLNGTTVGRFKRTIRGYGWRVVSEPRPPLGSIGRNAVRHRGARVAQAVSRLIYPLTAVPGIRELVLHRIVFILQKES